MERCGYWWLDQEDKADLSLAECVMTCPHFGACIIGLASIGSRKDFCRGPFVDLGAAWKLFSIGSE